MVPSFLLSLREGLEAALVIGIVFGVLDKMGRRDLRVNVWSGLAAAVVASLAAALAFNAIGAQFEGRAEEIFEGIAMLSAAALLTWMIFWMQRQSRSLRQDIERDVRQATVSGGWALFALAFLAIGREGLELALFLTAASAGSDPWLTVIGALTGLLVSALLGYLLFATSHKLSLQQFFRVTNLLLILFAAGLVAHGVHEFNEAGLIPAIVQPVWDTNAFLDENSTLGQLLQSLFGYNGNPSLTEVVAYFGYFALLWLLSRSSARMIPIRSSTK